MKILVTGGTGVIGTAAIAAFRRTGQAVRLLSRHADRDAPSLPDGVEPFAADIGDPAQLAGAAAGCDGVVHLAGIVDERPPELTFERVNVQGTRHLLDAAIAAGCPWLIHVSSLGAERSALAYHASKFRAEQLVRQYPGRWLILRPGNVYGPGDETISILLKLVRTLPAVPMIGDGRQPFQPLWQGDLARVLTDAVERPGLFGRTLELAGPEVTSTVDLLDRLARLTGRNPVRLSIPSWLAQLGTLAMEAGEVGGRGLLERAGLPMPITSAKLAMLLAGNVVAEEATNALGREFAFAPTPLQEGLERLADQLPEQLPGAGVGRVSHAMYWAEIRQARVSAEELLNWVCAHLPDVMPMSFVDHAAAAGPLEPGRTLTLRIPGRGEAQVRVVQRTASRVTFLTVEGHPLAGVMQLVAETAPAGIRFSAHVASQPATVLDWMAMRPLGGVLQAANWRNLVRHVVLLSGGQAPDGVRRIVYPMDSDETRELRASVERVVQDRREAVDAPRR